jgi:hypothetical protein
MTLKNSPLALTDGGVTAGTGGMGATGWWNRLTEKLPGHEPYERVETPFRDDAS